MGEKAKEIKSNKDDIFSLEELEVWKKCRTLRKEVSKLLKKFPQYEHYKLCDQMLRASRSATANIAEGYGRYHYQENIQFCRQARGSLYELLDHFSVALDEGFIDTDIFENFKGFILQTIKILNGYIRYLIKRKKSDVQQDFF